MPDLYLCFICFVQLCDNRDIPLVFLQNGSKSSGEVGVVPLINHFSPPPSH